MQCLSIRYLLDNNIVKEISPLKKNLAGLYYLVFTNNHNLSTKVYFTQNGNSYLEEKNREGDNILSLLEDADLIEVSYDKSKHKFKIYLSQVRNYTSEHQLSKIFNVDLKLNRDFNLNGFLNLFS